MASDTASRRLLSVSAAARILGVSTSSLRAWAAAGRVPHQRTSGGHRRFEPDELQAWLAARGGPPPTPPPRPHDLVPTRIEPVPELGQALRGRVDRVVADVERQLDARRPGGARRPALARRARLVEDVETFAEGLVDGDLTASFREAEWQGFRHGAAGHPGDVPVGEALALRRAIDGALGDAYRRRGAAEQRTVERLLDRMTVRVAAGFAEGLRSRLRARASQ
jgi:excisionase family DNA binding protein